MYGCERYSVHFMEEGYVQIEGKLTTSELRDLLEYLDFSGYNSISFNDGSIRLKNIDFEQERIKLIKEQNLENERFYQCEFENEKRRSEELQNRVRDLESLVKNLINEESSTSKLLKEKVHKLEKEKAINNLLNSPVSKDIINNFCHLEKSYE